MDEEIETQSPSYLFLIHRKRCRLRMWPVWTLTPSAPVQTAGPQRPCRPPVLSEPCSALSAGSLCFSELSLGQDSPLEVGLPAHTPKPLPGREKAGKKAPPRASLFSLRPSFQDLPQLLQLPLQLLLGALGSRGSGPWRQAPLRRSNISTSTHSSRPDSRGAPLPRGQRSSSLSVDSHRPPSSFF